MLQFLCMGATEISNWELNVTSMCGGSIAAMVIIKLK
jgi:hypothetical protein